MKAPNTQEILNHAETMRLFNENNQFDDLTRLLHEMAQAIHHLTQSLQALETTNKETN